MLLQHRHFSTGHRAAVYALAPGAAPSTFLSAGGDGWVVEWDFQKPEDGLLKASISTQVFSLCREARYDWIIAGNMHGGVHWIKPGAPEEGRDVQHHEMGVFSIIATPDGVITAGGDGMLARWDPARGRPLESLHLTNQALRCLAYEPSRNELAIGSSDNAIYILDAQSLEVRQKKSGAHTNSVFSLCYSPDGSRLLSGGRDAMLRVWDAAADFRMLLEQPAHLYTLNSIGYSPDGSHYATASRDKTLKIWDAESHKLLKVADTARFGGHLNSVNALLWSTEGIATASDDRTVGIWAFL